jgi:hypothetical protein
MIYFIGMAIAGGMLLAVGQSWATGFFAAGCAGTLSFGASAVWKRRRLSERRDDETNQQKSKPQ